MRLHKLVSTRKGRVLSLLAKARLSRKLPELLD